MFPGQATTGRAADLYGFEIGTHVVAMVIDDAAADIYDDLPQGGAKGNLDEAGMGHVFR